MKKSYIGLTVSLLMTGISIGDEAQPSEQRLRMTLTTFLDQALHEFTKELGSSTHSWEFGSKRWEEPYVTDKLLFLARMESYRLDAFSEGLAYDRTDPPVLKPPTPRSFWLPIAAEGTYSFNIISVKIHETTAKISVLFTNRIGDEEYRGDHVLYELFIEAEGWRIGNIKRGEEFDLVRYLQRPNVMKEPNKAEMATPRKPSD